MGGRQLLLQLADGLAPCKLLFKWVWNSKKKKNLKGQISAYYYYSNDGKNIFLFLNSKRSCRQTFCLSMMLISRNM